MRARPSATSKIIDAIQLLAETEGIFTEPAGGTTLAATIDLVRRGVIDRDESVVVCVTGNGYKTAEVMKDRLLNPVNLGRAFKEFEAWWESRQAAPRRKLKGQRQREAAPAADAVEALDSIGILISVVRPFRSTLNVAVVPILASATIFRSCDASATV